MPQPQRMSRARRDEHQGIRAELQADRFGHGLARAGWYGCHARQDGASRPGSGDEVLTGGEPPSLEPGEAYQRCLQELQLPHPDCPMAQVWAILALEETLRGVGAQVAEVAHRITLASRRR
jgi:hypothetical protein